MIGTEPQDLETSLSSGLFASQAFSRESFKVGVGGFLCQSVHYQFYVDMPQRTCHRMWGTMQITPTPLSAQSPQIELRVLRGTQGSDCSHGFGIRVCIKLQLWPGWSLGCGRDVTSEAPDLFIRTRGWQAAGAVAERPSFRVCPPVCGGQSRECSVIDFWQ